MRSRCASSLFTAALVLIPSAVFAQPANDACSASESISGFGTFNWSSDLGTTDGLANATCSFFGQDQISNDIWYCWTSPTSGAVEVSTCTQTSLDTKIAVYQGCVCFEGSAILACADDSCATQSTVQFTATAGASYLIRIGSYSDASTGSGTFSLGAYAPVTVAGPITNPANGHAYYLLGPSAWSRAESDAVSLGGHLVTINDADENEWVRANVLGFDGADRRGWIGFNDVANEGAFVWSSGEASTYTNWNGGEPNNSGGVEHYTEMFGSGTGLWNDQPDAPIGLSVYGIVEITPPPACPADFNGSGSVTVQDIFDFLSAYFDNNVAADFNESGTVTVQDIFDFLNAYFAGCP